MIAKKNSRFDLERRRIVLFQVGLLASSSLTLAAFTYKTDEMREHERIVSDFTPVTYFQDPLEKPAEQDPDPVQNQQPQTQQDQQNQMTATQVTTFSENSQVVNNTATVIKPNLGLPNVGPVDNGIIAIDTGDEPEEFPPIPAEYIGGYGAMQEYIGEHLNYPQIDIEAGEQGKVYLVFIVEKDGSVSNVGVERGVTQTIDREAKRIVRSFPKWKPAENAYGKVRARVRLPINFLLE